MLEDGLSYPMQGDSWIGRTLIGGLLLVFSPFVLPAFVFYGYLLRVLGSTIEGEAEPPAWGDWGGLLVDGLKATVVGIVYALVPTILIFGVGAVFIGAGSAAGSDGGGLLAGFGILTVLLTIPVLFLVYYLVPAALSNMAAEGSLGAAFDVDMLKQVVLTSDYFIAVLLPIVVGIGINVVAQILAITIVGLLVVPFLMFYGQVAVFRMFGLAFAKQADKISGQPSTVTTSA